jgi:hypothetical protein
MTSDGLATVSSATHILPVPDGVATISLLHQRSIARSETLSEQPQTALPSRVVIEQAKGKLAERLGLDIAGVRPSSSQESLPGIADGVCPA